MPRGGFESSQPLPPLELDLRRRLTLGWFCRGQPFRRLGRRDPFRCFRRRQPFRCFSRRASFWWLRSRRSGPDPGQRIYSDGCVDHVHSSDRLRIAYPPVRCIKTAAGQRPTGVRASVGAPVGRRPPVFDERFHCPAHQLDARSGYTLAVGPQQRPGSIRVV